MALSIEHLPLFRNNAISVSNFVRQLTFSYILFVRRSNKTELLHTTKCDCVLSRQYIVLRYYLELYIDCIHFGFTGFANNALMFILYMHTYHHACKPLGKADATNLHSLCS